jgi:hypothetical protein
MRYHPSRYDQPVDGQGAKLLGLVAVVAIVMLVTIEATVLAVLGVLFGLLGLGAVIGSAVESHQRRA